MKKFLIAATLIAGIATSATAHAEMRIKVAVDASEPNYVTKTIRNPQQQCNIVDVPIYGSTGSGANAGDVLGGMIIG